MIKTFASIGILMLALNASDVWAATATNVGTEAQTVTVTERGKSNELTIAAGETMEFCIDGCFVTFANGDKQALTGSEHLDVAGGAGIIK